jgi:hypothetical protein
MKSKSGSPEARYIDRPEVSEVFADRLEHLFFDGGTVRMEFTVVRTESAQSAPGRPTTESKQWSYTACRVVLAARGAAEMLNKMLELQKVMLDQGALQPQAPAPATNSSQPAP